MALMSKRAYARLKGVDEKTVRKAIAAGKIPLVDGLVDSDVADASWSRNRDGGQQSKLADAASQAPPCLPPAPPEIASLIGNPASVGTASVSAGPLALPQEPAAQPAFTLAPLTEARIENTRESTLLKELARRRIEGSLLDAEEVERTWGQMLQTLKDRLLLIPDDVAPAVTGSTDEAQVRSILTHEILAALGAMSRDIAGMAAA